jgi:hypothetical protein
VTNVYFDGQDGANDAFNITASLGIMSGTNNVSANSIAIIGDSEFVTYGGVFSHDRAESIRLGTSTRAGLDNVFNVSALADGVALNLPGGVGSDRLNLGSAGTVDNIRGKVIFGGETIVVTDTADTSGDIVHLDANSLGAYAGDTLFGAGGSLAFSTNATSLTVNLGSGADTIYAHPLAKTPATINANGPAAAPGDRLTLGLAGVQSPVVSSGGVASSNFQPLNWTGIDSAVSTDAVAPTVTSSASQLDGLLVNGRRLQSVNFVFSENVAGRLGVDSIELSNRATGAVIPASDLTFAYDATTRTARFAYLNGLLPDANYRARLRAGLPDGAGNPLAADSVVDFFVLTGDVNRDRQISFSDLITTSAKFGKTNALYGDGDTNGDGQVTFADLVTVSSKFGKSLALPSEPVASAPMAAAASAGSVNRRLFSKTLVSKPKPAKKAMARIGVR